MNDTHHTRQLKDKDSHESCECYGDRGVPNCKLISLWEFDKESSSSQSDQVQNKWPFQGI